MSETATAALFFEEHLRSFVPLACFDAHAHLYRGMDAIGALPEGVADTDGNVGFSAYERTLGTWMGDRRPEGGLFFTIPKPTLDVVGANQFVFNEVRDRPDSRALMLVRPHDDADAVQAQLDSHAIAGFKVYHVYADRDDTFNAAPDEYIPEWAWEMANERGLAITLHLVRSRALADPANQQYIHEHCRRYPQARLILAHAARGFCAAHTVEGISTLRGIDNVFFDSSAICEPQAFEAIIREFGPTRLLFGTDFSVSEVTGKCVSIGDGFLWLSAENVEWGGAEFAEATLVGVESLLALKQACHNMHLNDGDVERIFRTNARQLLGIDASNASAKTLEAYRSAKTVIPGGTQLLSKRPEMYAPDCWPGYFSEARGCEVVDLDGRRFCDMTTSGIGSCLLGYADPDVTSAVLRRVQLGSMCTLNPVEEKELAELLISVHPWADQARFCRTGGESMAAAVRIARAHTGADRVAFCGYHGWSDWYLAANLPESDASAASDRLEGHLLPGLDPRGVPQGLAGTALPFRYNRLDELQRIVDSHAGELAAVVMEPTRSTDPDPGFLEGVRALCDQHKLVLVFDEITTGWRMHAGGVHLRYGVEPDLVVFAKALGSGHPMGAILGRRDVMQAAQESFISSTYWTEGVGAAAALATVRKFLRCDVPAHVERIGTLFRDGCHELAQRHGVPVNVTGHAALLHIAFEHSDAAALGTLLTTRMLDHGILAGSGFYPSYAHTEQHVERYLAAADVVFGELAQAIQKDDVRGRLKGDVRHSGFQRLT